MYRGYFSWKKESQNRASPQVNSMPAVSASPSSSSLASSLSSYAASSVLPTVAPSNSSQSDIASCDHAVSCSAPNPSPKNRFFPISISPTARSSSLAHMGQTTSRTAPSSPLPQPQPIEVSASSPPPLSFSTSRLKGLWSGRRKRPVDAAPSPIDTYNQNGKGKERAPDVSAYSSTFTTPASSVHDLHSATAGSFHQKQSSHPPKSPKFSGSPPLPPPKPVYLPAMEKPPTAVDGEHSTYRSTLQSAGAASGLLMPPRQVQSLDEAKEELLSLSARDKSEGEIKQDWRKSDSTTMSYVTIRPGSLTGSRSPRPVSLAESSHSGHTIVPVNRRLSALITDAEYAMAEEGDSDSDGEYTVLRTSQRTSPASSVKAQNRRSASMSYGPVRSKSSTPEPASVPGSRLSRTLTDMNRLQLQSPPRENATPFTARGTATQVLESPNAHNSRGPSTAWGAERSAPPTIPIQPLRPVQPSIRQTAVSITGNLAPVAMGLGRRAAEKVHRVWGGLSSSSSGHSTHSSSSSVSLSTTGTGAYPDSLGRAPSAQSFYAIPNSFPGGWKGKRRTPNAPSGAWSVASSVTSSESEGFSGPNLGICLRGPKRNAAGMTVIGGVVFGRDLRACVQETAIDSVRSRLGQPYADEYVGVKPLEERLLPALVVRCVQHLMTWGLQEEGLFRINGRASHVARLRSAFDTGADYNLAQCDPGDLDPHAVTSIFKAYLRELPQSLLTSALIPLFESALVEDVDHSQTERPPSTQPTRNGLPMLRKPPSLSTLAMPSFAGQRAMSDRTIATLATLVAELPEENRDLLYTVVELISATASRSRETKMPLGNLLLVFCPSLNMSPTLLRVLCEAKGIWDRQTVQASDTAETNVSIVAPESELASAADATYYDSDSDVPPARPRPGRGRGPVRTMLHVPGFDSPGRCSSNSGSGQDDNASYVSALDRSPSSFNDSSTHLPALTTSSDSIATPSTMSEVSSLQQQPATSSPVGEFSQKSSHSPIESSDLRTVIDLSLPDLPKRPCINANVPFPSTNGGGSPRTPSSASSRKSLALLSFPPLGRLDASQAGGTVPRPKRPSLHMLFSKRSASSLASPSLTISKPELIAAPSDMPHIAIPTRPEVPVLDTPISSSPIRLFDATGELRLQASSIHASVAAGLLSPGDSDNELRERTDSSSGSSLFSTPQQTPIADFFRGRTTSIVSVAADEQAVQHEDTSQSNPPIPRSASQVSLTPSIDIGIEDDNWAESVIMQAAATSDTSDSSWPHPDAFGHTKTSICLPPSY